MQLTKKNLRRINIFTTVPTESGYIGKKPSPKLLGFVYAEVFPEKETLSSEREGKKTDAGAATLILRRGAGVSCGDLAGVFGDSPDSRITQVLRCQSHITAKAERL